ncbi:MAG: tetratricopeptide repeat protein [Myxococcales bacterium]|jgi:hypothetical protein|nr:tetratricopeptide repeat protein [Myxococcales bacterium]
MRFAPSCGLALVVALAMSPSLARAEGPARSSAGFTLRKDEAGGAAGATARARARAGDCKGALTHFDAAIQITIDPTLRRDRGICFEKLQDPYPAIDDYRYYVTNRPDAPDAEQIRERLARLEEQTGTSQASDNRGSKVTNESSTSRSTSYDTLQSEIRNSNIAEDSPLRRGTGVVIGAFGGLRKFMGKTSPDDLGYTVGGTIRYSASANATLYLDAQYVGIGESGSSGKQSGPGTYFGFELRLHLTKYASDAILLGAALGYEGYTESNTQVRTHYGIGRGRFGYRHVFGPSLGLELTGDGAGALAFFDNLPAGVDKSSELRFMLGGNLALVVGF